MGKQKKTAKGRLDKYYKLAKEQGYRSRSAFKLIQLNKRFSFLESARCCVDLCAAPGGWLQVASKYMPVKSVIIGVDLVPIKPIPNVVTFVADITTSRCRDLIRNELKDWRADVVLHDGAPNVGVAWVQDAYSQSELVLMSLKLAVDFLIQGGIFITKIFRSADYNNLLWVFNQLFEKVEATKPPSSRTVSAEIFVVCRGFLAPKRIDPKFLDPKHVFKDLSASAPSGTDQSSSVNNVQANVFQPGKKRRQRDGYEEGNYTLFKKTSVGDFVRTNDPIAMLGSVSKLAFESEEEQQWLALEITTADIQANCNDLKVLGKSDFKALLKWRAALRGMIGLEVKAKSTENATEHVEITEEPDDDTLIEDELERLNAEAAARAKRQRRRANELKSKTIRRMQLQMTTPMDIGLEQTDLALSFGQDDIFNFMDPEKSLKKRGGFTDDSTHDRDMSSESDLDQDVISGPEALTADEDLESQADGLEVELEGLYNAYQERLKEKDAKLRAREARKKNKEREEWGGISAVKEDGRSDNEDTSGSEDGGWEEMQKAKDNTSEESSSEGSVDGGASAVGKKRKTTSEVVPVSKKVRFATSHEEKPTPSRATQLWFSQDIFSGMQGLDLGDKGDIEPSSLHAEVRSSRNRHVVGPRQGEDASVADDFEIVPRDRSDDDMWEIENGDENEVKKAVTNRHSLVTPEAVTLALQLVNGEKTKTQLINDGFNRYSLNSKEGLPSWFLDDEARAYRSNIPITKEAVAALRAKQLALNARPIKKVVEAKARKKYKAAQRLQKALKKAEGIDSSDMTEQEKAQQIEKLMRKGTAKKQERKKVKVVVAKGAHRGIKGRPKGVKGRYVMVDARMRKEMRAKKRQEKSRGKRKRS